MKVTSNKTIDFPKFRWGISVGETRDLPEDKEAQKIILAHKAISQVGGSVEKKNEKEDDK